MVKRLEVVRVRCPHCDAPQLVVAGGVSRCPYCGGSFSVRQIDLKVEKVPHSLSSVPPRY